MQIQQAAGLLETLGEAMLIRGMGATSETKDAALILANSFRHRLREAQAPAAPALGQEDVDSR